MVMYARNDFAHTSFDAGLLPQICNIFSSSFDDDTGILGAHESTKGEGFSFSGARGRGAGLGQGGAYPIFDFS
jgi:hypothetical protein